MGLIPDKISAIPTMFDQLRRLGRQRKPKVFALFGNFFLNSCTMFAFSDYCPEFVLQIC